MPQKKSSRRNLSPRQSKEKRGSGRPSHEESHDTRENLIKAATDVFAKKGFSGTTVKDIAEAAATNVAMVSYYFEGKEGLFRACLDKFSSEKLELSDKLLAPPQSSEDFRVRLQTWVEFVIEGQVHSAKHMQICFREMESDNLAVREVFSQTILRLFDRLIEFFRQTQKHGLIQKDLDPFMLASILQASLLHMVRMDKFRAQLYGSKFSITNPEFRKKMVTHILKLFLQGVL